MRNSNETFADTGETSALAARPHCWEEYWRFLEDEGLVGRHRVVVAEDLDEATIAGVPRVGGNDTVEGLALGAVAGESDSNHDGSPGELGCSKSL